MNVLLDECIDRNLTKDIVGHGVKSAVEMGWAALKNGELLTLAEKQFEVFITVDRNLSFQQNLPKYDIAVIVIHVPTNRLADLRLAVPELLESIPVAQIGKATHIRVAHA